MTLSGDRTTALVVVPTYNEAENIQPVVERTLASTQSAEVLIVDDNSPDGTGDIADKLAELDSRVNVLHRQSKDGLGAAYCAGFAWALARDYEAVVEMDADGSHQPEDIPRLLTGLEIADVAVGSRWVPGGCAENWPRHREAISRGGSLFARRALGLRLRDATGGFRAFRREALEHLPLDHVNSRGYCFQVEMAHRAVESGMSAVEVPIVFRERERGTSKMTLRIMVEALWRISGWAVARRARQSRRLVAALAS